MPTRTWQQIEAQKSAALAKANAATQSLSQTASIQATPPAFISGFKIILTPELKIQIQPGVINVAGQRVDHSAVYTLKPEDEQMARMSKTWWYLYIDRNHRFYGDVIAPAYNSTFFADYHPNHAWRYIGKYFVCNDHYCRYVQDISEKSDQELYIAPSDFEGPANYYCTGTDDHILINAAIQYLNEAYSGGRVTLLPGTFSIRDTILLRDNCTLSGSDKAANLRIDANMTRCVNFYGTATVTNAILTGCKFTQTSGYACSTAVVGSSVPTYYCKIEDNYFAQTTGTAIRASMDIIGNYIVGVAATGAQHGIWFSGSRTMVIHNEISGIYSNNANVYAIRCDGNEALIWNNKITTIYTADAASYAYGIYIVSDDCFVMANNVYFVSGATTANGRGIFIYDASRYRTKVIGNSCKDCGSDSGITNTNQCNFDDNGSDTLIYSNSWQQPVASEPSIGTYHPLLTPYAIHTTATATTATTGYDTVSSTAIPVGAKMIDVAGYAITTALNSLFTISRMWPSTQVVIRGASQVASYPIYFCGNVPLSSTNGYKWSCGTTGMTFNITANGYWL